MQVSKPASSTKNYVKPLFPIQSPSFSTLIITITLYIGLDDLMIIKKDIFTKQVIVKTALLHVFVHK